MSAEGGRKRPDRVGEKAGQMADRLQREGAKGLAQRLTASGAGADKSAEQFSRAEGKMAHVHQARHHQYEQLGKTASEKLQFQINQKGWTHQKFEPMLASCASWKPPIPVSACQAQTAAALYAMFQHSSPISLFRWPPGKSRLLFFCSRVGS